MDTEEDYINYALPKVKELIKNKEFHLGWGQNVDVSNIKEVKLVKQENSQWYEILIKREGENEFSYIDVILIQNTTKVVDEVAISKHSGLVLEGTEIKNNESIYEELQNKIKEKGYNKIFNSYELKLKSGNIGENGLTITFSLGENNNGKRAIVLHKKHNGTYEEFVKTVENGKIAITVTELSPFIIGMEEDTYLLVYVNEDGTIDTEDAVMILKHLAGNITLNSTQMQAADTSKDGSIDTEDAVRILKKLAGNITEF